MFHIVLYQPEIPPNTGNIIRLCANSGSRLHLVHPLGFAMDDRRLRRAGLDYHEWVRVEQHADFNRCRARLAGAGRWFALSTRGGVRYDQAGFRPGDVFLFGPETRGLPTELLQAVAEERRLRLPMRAGQRSLNLANSVAVVLYEAWRQQGFAGAAP